MIACDTKSAQAVWAAAKPNEDATCNANVAERSIQGLVSGDKISRGSL